MRIIARHIIICSTNKSYQSKHKPVVCNCDITTAYQLFKKDNNSVKFVSVLGMKTDRGLDRSWNAMNN